MKNHMLLQQRIFFDEEFEIATLILLKIVEIEMIFSLLIVQPMLERYYLMIKDMDDYYFDHHIVMAVAVFVLLVEDHRYFHNHFFESPSDQS